MNPITRMMKRYIKMPLKYALPLLFIGALVLASTTGCVTVTTNNTASNETAVTGTAKVVSQSTTLTSYDQTATASAGNNFVKVAVFLKNVNAQNASLGSPLDFNLRDSAGNLHTYDTSVGFLQNETVNGISLTDIDVAPHTQPGDSANGLLVFQIPQNTTPKTLIYDDYSYRVTMPL